MSLTSRESAPLDLAVDDGQHAPIQKAEHHSAHRHEGEAGIDDEPESCGLAER